MFNKNRKATIVQLEKYVADIKARRPVEAEPVVSTKPAPERFIWGLCSPLGSWTAYYDAA